MRRELIKQTEVVPDMYFDKKSILKICSKLQKNTYTKVSFQLLKSHFDTGVLL